MVEMDAPSIFDFMIRYSLPRHQRSTFDRVIAGLSTDFLSFPVTVEAFGSKVECKARLQGFALSRGSAVIIGKYS